MDDRLRDALETLSDDAVEVITYELPGCPCRGCVWDTLDRDGNYGQCSKCTRKGRKKQ